MFNISRKRIQGNSVGPRLLILGGVHGDEFEPMAAIRRLITQIRPEKLKGQVTLVPVVNEPAFNRCHRCADDGLDLARTFPGNPSGSMTERIAWSVTSLIHDSDFLIDLHTGGTNLSVFPLAGYMLHPDASILETQRKMAQAMNLPIVWGTDASLNGRTLSVARDADIPAIYAEYLGSASCSPQGIDAYVNGCLNVLSALEMYPSTSDDRPPDSMILVEDNRRDSGHLQIQNPSPCAGYFTPFVVLGQFVHAGDVLGTVCDPLGEVIEPVVADHDGLVIVLRTYPRVAEGESLLVILNPEPGKGEME